MMCRYLRTYRWGAAVALLLLFTGLSRLPFQSQLPVNWDAVQYVLALSEFNIAAHQPHPPGNPLYVLLGYVIHHVIADPNQALVAMSVLASLVTVWGTAVLGARLAGRAIGLWAAALLAVNPIFWFYGEVALSYAPEAAVGVLLALAVWRAFAQPSWLSAVLIGLAFAFAGGMRPTVLPLLAPLWLFGLVRLSRRDRALAGSAALLGILAWLVPLLTLAGGPLTYWTELRRLSAVAVKPTSLFAGPSVDWLTNLGVVLVALAVALNGLIPLIGIALRRAQPQLWELSARTVFLFAWLLPPLAMYTLVHFGQWGYILLILPPVLILSLLQVKRILPAGLGASRSVLRLGPAVVGSVAIFALLPLLPWFSFQPTAAYIEGNESTWNRVTRLVSTLPPEETLVLANADARQSFRLAGYLLPEYQIIGVGHDLDGRWGGVYRAEQGKSTYRLDPDLRADRLLTTHAVRYVVILDPMLGKLVADPRSWHHIQLDHGNDVLLLATSAPTMHVSFLGDEIHVLPMTAQSG